MKIAHVVDQLSLTHGGGVAMCVYKLAEAQARLGHDVSIFTTDWKMAGQKPPEGVDLRAFPLSGSPLGVRVATGMLKAKLPEGSIAHIHNYRGFPELVMARGNHPFVLEAHGSLPLGNGQRPMTRLIENVWRRGIFNRASAYIAESQIEVDQYVGYGASPKDIEVITPGIDWREFEHLPPRREHDYRTVLYLGRLNAIKGVDLLIQAFKEINRDDVRLLIAGPDDGDRDRLRAIAESSPRILFVGPLYGKDKIQAYVDADLYVLPSRYEIFGITVLEAMACGCQVLVPAHSGAALTFPKQISVFTEDILPLSTAINAALNHPHFWSSPGVLRKLASEYDWMFLAQKHLGLYQEVLD